MSNIANIEVIQSYLILADSKAEKQTSVNTSKSRLNKNRIAAKNEKIQNVICSQIDNQITSIKKLEYRQQRKADRQAKRK